MLEESYKKYLGAKVIHGAGEPGMYQVSCRGWE